MSNPALIALGVLLVILVAFAYLRGERSRAAKFILTVFAVAAVSGVTYTLEDYKGWPTEAPVRHGRVVGVEIVKPDIGTNGHIYVWVYPVGNSVVHNWLTDMLYSSADKAPLNYALPFSKKSAKQFQNAQKALSDGDIVDMDSVSGVPHEGGAGADGNGEDGGGKEPPHGDNSSGATADNEAPDSGFNLRITKPEDLLKKDN